MLTVSQMSAAVSARKRKSTFLARKAFHYLTPKIQSAIKATIDVKKGSERLAPLVTALMGNPVFTKDSFHRLELEIPLLGGAVETSIEAKFNVLAGMPDTVMTDIAELVDTLADDTELVDSAITRTEEFMAAELLKTGSVTIHGLGISGQEIAYTLDFQRNPDHRIILSGGATWGSAGVSPFNDIKDTRLLIAANGGINPNHVVMGEEAAELFLSDSKTRDRLDNRGMDYGKISPEELDVDVTYLGYVREIGHIYTYLGGYEDKDKMKQRYIPARGVALFSEGADNRTIYGGVARNVNGRAVIERGRRVVSHKLTERQPVMETLDVNARVLLTLTEPDTTAYLEV